MGEQLTLYELNKEGSGFVPRTIDTLLKAPPPRTWPSVSTSVLASLLVLSPSSVNSGTVSA
jgi:hypothetical protein